MSTFSIGQILGGRAEKTARSIDPQTGEPVKVWRESFHKGEREHTVWRAIAATKRNYQRRKRCLIARAREHEVRTLRERQKLEPKARNGELGGSIGLQVLELLWDRVDWRNGRLDLAVLSIADILGKSYKAVHRALSALTSAGYLDWIRRTEPTDSRDGPQVRQISNAYELKMPRQVEKVVDAATNDGSAGLAYASWYKFLDGVGWTSRRPKAVHADSAPEGMLQRIEQKIIDRECTRVIESRASL